MFVITIDTEIELAVVAVTHSTVHRCNLDSGNFRSMFGCCTRTKDLHVPCADSHRISR